MTFKKWIDLINEFEKFGGIAKNVYQKIGINGRGLFPIDEKKKTKIFTPKSLFIPEDCLKLKNKEIMVTSNSPFKNETIEFFNYYYNDFSWGNGGKESVEIFENNLKDLPASIKNILDKNKIINFEKRHHGDWREVIFRRFISSRAFNIGNQRYLIPIAELVNHDNKSLPFNINAFGINSKTKNSSPNEITNQYTFSSPISMFLKYGIISEIPICYSIPFEINLPEVSLKLICTGKSLLNDKKLIKINKNKFIFFDIKKDKSKRKILDEYINQIPKKIGLSIFSFAEDGHVFSLFFNEKNFKQNNKRAFYTIKKKNFSRFSISTKTFNSVKSHIILCKSIKCYKLFEQQKKTKKGIFRYTEISNKPYIVCVKK